MFSYFQSCMHICMVWLWFLSWIYWLIGTLIYYWLFALSGIMLWTYFPFLIIAFCMIAISPIILIFWAIWAYKIFRKMWEKWWKALIPILNMYIVYEKINMNREFILVIIGILFLYLWDKRSFNSTSLWLLILFSIDTIITIVAVVLVPIILIKAAYRLPRKFGRSKRVSILYIFFSPICLPILWFWNYKFNSKENGKDKTLTNDTNPETIHIETIINNQIRNSTKTNQNLTNNQPNNIL